MLKLKRMLKLKQMIYYPKSIWRYFFPGTTQKRRSGNDPNDERWEMKRRLSHLRAPAREMAKYRFRPSHASRCAARRKALDFCASAIYIMGENQDSQRFLLGTVNKVKQLFEAYYYFRFAFFYEGTTQYGFAEPLQA